MARASVLSKEQNAAVLMSLHSGNRELPKGGLRAAWAGLPLWLGSGSGPQVRKADWPPELIARIARAADAAAGA